MLIILDAEVMWADARRGVAGLRFDVTSSALRAKLFRFLSSHIAGTAAGDG
jgi:hypothetical protein